MVTVNRRRALCLAGSALAGAVAGCSDGTDRQDTPTPSSQDTPTPTGQDTPTPTPSSQDTPTPTSTDRSSAVVQGSESDTDLTFTLRGRAEDFQTLVVDFDRVEFIGDSDDVTVQIDDTGVDLTALPADGRTYLDNDPFPSDTYERLDLYMTIQEYTFDGHGIPGFYYEPPVSESYPLDISDGWSYDLSCTVSGLKPEGAEEYWLVVTRLGFGGNPRDT